ncbi:cytochrome bd oxidase small subunit, CydX/CbdX family [Vibrio lentus]|nr:cytochrome bd oxidase small subunit, CydX/CbdX family [Vibrio lentus]
MCEHLCWVLGVLACAFGIINTLWLRYRLSR